MFFLSGGERERRDEILLLSVFDFFFLFSASSLLPNSLSSQLFSLFLYRSPRGLAPSSTARAATFDAPSVATRAALRGRRARTVAAAGAGEMIDDDWSSDDEGAFSSSPPLGDAARAPAASEDAEVIKEGSRCDAGGEEDGELPKRRREEGQQRCRGRAASGVGGAVLAEVDAGIAAAELQLANNCILVAGTNCPEATDERKRTQKRDRERNKQGVSSHFSFFRNVEGKTFDPLLLSLSPLFFIEKGALLRRACVYMRFERRHA